MGRTGIVVTGIVGIALVVGGIVAFGHKKDNSTTSNSTAASNTPASAPTTTGNSSTSTQPPTVAASITYSASGFSPSSVTVNSGDTIAIVNSSSSQVQFQSDPHPTHTDDPELNVGVITPGQASMLKLTTKGTHGYHNHLNTSQTGTIIVK